MRKVAIAISTFNSGITLAQTLESLLQFEHLSGATFILLDGGSTDFSVNIFEWFKKKYDHSFGFEVRIYPGMHPAERLNILIQEARYEFLFSCHSDDIYSTSKMCRQLRILESRGGWACAAQCHYFLDPIDSLILKRPLYVGKHKSHPRSPDSIFCEMSLWWSISWNTILLRPKEIVNAGILLDPSRYKFSNDYRFNWDLAKLKKISSVNFSTVITRQRSKGDGQSNIETLNKEFSEIKELIQREIGLSSFLGMDLSNVMNSISYSYGKWAIQDKIYSISDYRDLSNKLIAFSAERKDLSHFEKLGQAMIRDIVLAEGY